MEGGAPSEGGCIDEWTRVERGDSREKREGAYSDGGVLRRRKQCLAILAELAVKHCPSVSQQRGQDPPSGHLQDLEGKDRRQERLKY